MTDRREFLLATGVLTAAAASPVLAQSFPSRPVTLYCAFPAGGPTDQVFRAFAEAAAKTLGQSVVVENKPGAGGTLAALSMRGARADGYTLAQMPMGLFRIPHMQKTPTFDPINDFTYVVNLTGYTFGLVVPSGAPFKTVKELVDYAKANPGKLNYGSTGVGTSPHLAVEEFASRAGIRLNHVPFKGSADLMQAILGGHIMAASDSTGWAPHVASGRLRLLATYGSKRTKRWPDVPTLDELGYQTVSDSPFGLGGPKGMDPAVVKTLQDAFRKAMDEPKVQQILDRFDQPMVYMSAADYTAWATKTYAAEEATIERLGMKGTM
ncbi:MAG TPA: tripartite tricarboxylate transporter substrate binding protein [Burkholderiaceae bacterium]|nr:tripartite tricarboxylate transporter substrate binding protein [Burkholderiaceae bacterium]